MTLYEVELWYSGPFNVVVDAVNPTEAMCEAARILSQVHKQPIRIERVGPITKLQGRSENATGGLDKGA